MKRGKCVRREREESEAREIASAAFLSWRKEVKCFDTDWGGSEYSQVRVGDAQESLIN